MPKKKRNLLKNMKFDEISFCSEGMNVDANITILKAEDYEKAAQLFDQVLESIEMGEDVEHMMRLIMKYNEALQQSVYDILYDESVKDKKEKVAESLDQYIEAVKACNDKRMRKSFEKWISENPDVDQDDINTYISKEVRNMDKLKELEQQLEKAVKENEDLKTDLAKALRLSSMTDSQKAYMAGMTEEQQTEYLAKSNEEMDSLIEKAQADEETLEISGTIIRKSESNAKVFAILKAQQEDIEKERKKAAKEREKLAKAEAARILKEYEDKAENEYPNLPGDKAHKGMLLKTVDDMPDEAKATAYSILKASNKAMGQNFESSGSSVAPNLSSAEEKLNKMAQDKASSDGISFAKAYDEVLRTPEGSSLYQETLN